METFDQWLMRTQARRDYLMAYGKTGKPSTAEGRSLDSLTAIEKTDEAARILAEAESHLTFERSKAMLEVRKTHPDMNSRERELMEKSIVRDIQRVVDSCAITYKSCLSRYFNYKGSR